MTTRLSQGLTASTTFAHAHTAGCHQIASEMGTPRGPQIASEMGMGVPISRGSPNRSYTGVGVWNDPRWEMTPGSFYPSV